MVSRWLWPGNRTFLEVASMVVITWWIVAFCAVTAYEETYNLFFSLSLSEPWLVIQPGIVSRQRECVHACFCWLFTSMINQIKPPGCMVLEWWYCCHIAETISVLFFIIHVDLCIFLESWTYYVFVLFAGVANHIGQEVIALNSALIKIQ